MVVGSKEELLGFISPFSFPFFIEGLLLLPPVPHTTPSYAPAWPLTKGGEKKNVGEMVIFLVVKPKQQHAEKRESLWPLTTHLE